MSEQAVKKDLWLQLESLWHKNSKIIIIVVSAIVLISAGLYGYKEYVVLPKEEKAADALYKVQQWYAQDSSNYVINGDTTGAKGALYIIKNFSGTKSANLAHFYAGVSYLKLKDFSNAIKHLKDFSTKSLPIQMAAYTALGHAYAESDKKEEAVKYYKKAGTTFEDDKDNSAENLFLAAQLLETMNKGKEALELYKTIKQKYPQTNKGNQADKYIYRLSIEKNDFSIN
ncbi:MAG: tetratricopeptide repeat protein [Chitinophagaceae bacterium]|nr:tetratricopeptide repeat protein [Chitinophagaceae bacterium]MCW5905043.1 tetratricopeptide repeat protein [Chitinophagaceae bacterium]